MAFILALVIVARLLVGPDQTEFKQPWTQSTTLTDSLPQL